MLLNFLLLGALSVAGENTPAKTNISDTVRLKEVVVNSKLKRYSSGLSMKVISSGEIQQGKSLLLSDMLSSQSNISINTYGPGATSTVSMRGLSAAHTAVLWNGINLQSTMNGGVNFGNIPTFFVDQIAVQQGGNGALFGSGAIGGVIHLDNTLDFGRGHSGEFFQSVGSYGLTYTAAKYSYSSKKVALSSRLFYTEAQNNYKYRDDQNNLFRQNNSNYRKAGLMQTATFALTEKDKLVVSYWGQDAFNRYPPIIGQTKSKQHDYYTFSRISTQWQANRKNIDFNIKSALFNDWQAYRDPYGANSDHRSLTAQLEGEAIFRLNSNQTIEGGIYTNLERVNSTNYKNTKSRLRPAMSAVYRYKTPNELLDAFASVRYEAVKGETTPITGSLGLQLRLLKGLYFRANASRNYRLPSFNDLYWVPGGNPDLKPETGYSQEANLDYLLVKNDYLFSIKVAAFNNTVSNWILWKPQENGFWSPVNYKKVWSRGAEGAATIKKRWSKITVGADLSGSITFTTDQTNDSQDKGKQLFYVPRYKAAASIYADYQNFRIRYTQSYVGRRFYKDDRSEWLNPYSLANISAEKSIIVKGYTIRAFARIDNVWNESYVVQLSYAMPLLTYQIGIALQLGENQ